MLLTCSEKNRGIDRIDLLTRCDRNTVLFVCREALLILSCLIVSSRLDTSDQTQDKIHASVAKIFATMHRSVSDMALIMFAELRRQIYVTPTNYLELVSGYKR